MQGVAVDRKIDELGRIILPKDIRQRANWETGDSLSVSYDQETQTATLKLNEKCAGPKCAICGKSESKCVVNERDICASCLEGIKTAEL